MAFLPLLKWPYYWILYIPVSEVYISSVKSP